jgi:anti-sigma B factor antagonist
MVAFAVEVADAQQCAVVRVSGELDIATAPLLDETLETAQGRSQPVVIDLGPTTFCDSTGMTVILRAHRRAGEGRLPFIVVCPSDNREVGRVLALLGFDTVFDLREDVDAAVLAVCGDGLDEATADA